jgi:hypothetical protein
LATPSVRWRPEPPLQKRFLLGDEDDYAHEDVCIAWLGKSKKDWPPSPWRRTFKPAVPAEFVVMAPVTPEEAVNWLAGALIL